MFTQLLSFISACFSLLTASRLGLMAWQQRRVRASGKPLAILIGGLRIDLLLTVVLAPCAFWVGNTPWEILLLLASLIGVLLVELINSAIEALADAISVEEHPLLGRAKDLGSAAVLLALCLAAGIWLTLLFF